MVPISVLDLAPIAEGSDASHALANSLDLARHAERWGYRRYWLARTTTCRGSRARRPPWSSAGSPAVRRQLADLRPRRAPSPVRASRAGVWADLKVCAT